MSAFWAFFSPHQLSAQPKRWHTANKRKRIEPEWRQDCSFTRSMVHIAALWHPQPRLWLGEWRRAIRWGCNRCMTQGLADLEAEAKESWAGQGSSSFHTGPKKQPKAFTTDNWGRRELWKEIGTESQFVSLCNQPKFLSAFYQFWSAHRLGLLIRSHTSWHQPRPTLLSAAANP